MKKLLKRLFKKEAYTRLKRLRFKQAERLRKVNEVIKELNEWSDIPMSWQWGSICRTLGIVQNQAAKDFIYENFLLSNRKPEQIAQRLPLP